MSGTHQFADVGQLAGELREPVDPHWPQQAADALVQDGLAEDARLDQVSGAAITGRGRLYVGEREHKTTILEDYRSHPANFVIVSGSGNQVAVGNSGNVSQVSLSPESRDQAVAIIGHTRDAVAQDVSIDEATRVDALTDIDAIEGQLHRDTVNRAVITALLSNLGSIASVAQFGVQLGQLLS